MSPALIIGALASGEPRGAAGLLPSCRAEAYGVEAFGPAAIAALFARNPAPLSRMPDIVVAARGLALFDADAEGREQVWFADLFGEAVGRLWRLGPGARDAAEPDPSLAFAFDPFLSQAREPVAFRAADHPELAPEAVPPLLEAVMFDPDAACRIVVLRAFSAADRTAALLACVGGSELRLGGLALRHADGRVLHSRLTWDAVVPKERKNVLF